MAFLKKFLKLAIEYATLLVILIIIVTVIVLIRDRQLFLDRSNPSPGSIASMRAKK